MLYKKRERKKKKIEKAIKTAKQKTSIKPDVILFYFLWFINNNVWSTTK